MSDKVLLFANPIAGRGRGRAAADRLARRLGAQGYRVSIFDQRPADVADAAIDPHAAAAIVIGGDGTIRAAARRLFERTDHGPPILVIPMGTANLLGRHLGIRWDEQTLESQVVAAIEQREIVELDGACANGELFLLMAGIGIDARVVHELDRVRSGPINFASYVLPGALALTLYDYPPLTVRIDGSTLCQDVPAMTFIGNVREYGTGFPLLPHARPDDGLLDICVMPTRNQTDAVRHFLHAAAGEHLMSEGVLYAKATRLTVESSASAPVQIDGEAAGHTPVEIRLLPYRVPFIVPRR